MARFAAALLVALLGAAGAHATAFPFTPCATDADCKEGFGCALGSCVPAGWQAEPEPIVATETVTVAEISRRQDEDEFESAESGPVDIGTPSSEPSEPSQPLDLSAEEPIDEYDLVDEEDPIDAEAHRLAKRQNCDAYCRYALHQAAKQASSLRNSATHGPIRATTTTRTTTSRTNRGRPTPRRALRAVHRRAVA